MGMDIVHMMIFVFKFDGALFNLSNHLNGQVWYFKANGHCVGQLYDMTCDDMCVFAWDEFKQDVSNKASL